MLLWASTGRDLEARGLNGSPKSNKMLWLIMYDTLHRTCGNVCAILAMFVNYLPHNFRLSEKRSTSVRRCFAIKRRAGYLEVILMLGRLQKGLIKQLG